MPDEARSDRLTCWDLETSAKGKRVAALKGRMRISRRRALRTGLLGGLSGASDLIVLTGDTHEWWANELFAKDGRRMGVELATSAVTSPGGSAYFGEDAETYSRLLNERNAMVRHHNPFGKGYIDLALGRDGAHADFVVVDTIMKKDYTATVDVSFDINRFDGSVSFGNS